MRVLLLGDSHRNATFLAEAFTEAARTGCEQILQVGDFGFGWQWLSLTETLAVCKFSAIASILVEKTGIGLSFLDGNHENFDRLAQLPLNAAGTREVAPGVFHLPRGHRFEMGGMSFLACGGATSLDRLARTRGVSWWAQEALTDDDVAACGTTPVDVLVCHDVPAQCGLRAAGSGFGYSADLDWYVNRLRLGTVLEATAPSLVVHGHLHQRYERDLSPELATRVVGLGSDRQPLAEASAVLDTETGELS